MTKCGHSHRLLVCLIWFSASFLSSLQGGTPRLPTWLDGKKHLLPEIDSGIVDKMRTHFEAIADQSDVGGPSAAFYAAAERITALREQASLAMLWVYAEDLPRINRDAAPIARKRSTVIHEVFHRDRFTVSWVVPLLRQRLDWAEAHFKAGRLDQIDFNDDELGAIEGYLNIRGDPADLKRVHDLMRRIAASETRFAASMLWVPDESESEVKANQSRRERASERTRAYYQHFAYYAEESKKLRQANPTSTPDGSRERLSHDSPPSSSSQTAMSESPSSSSSHAWSIAAAGVALAVLWLLLKRRA